MLSFVTNSYLFLKNCVTKLLGIAPISANSKFTMKYTVKVTIAVIFSVVSAIVSCVSVDGLPNAKLIIASKNPTALAQSIALCIFSSNAPRAAPAMRSMIIQKVVVISNLLIRLNFYSRTLDKKLYCFGFS